VQAQAEIREGTTAQQAMSRRTQARKSYLDSLASRKIRIAQLAATRTFQKWTPGDLACYWREAGRLGRETGSKVKAGQAGFVGPALVLGLTERADGRGGVKRVVWLVHNNEIIATSPQQLRPATTSERHYFHLSRIGPTGPVHVDLEALIRDHATHIDLTEQKPPEPKDLAEDEQRQDTYVHTEHVAQQETAEPDQPAQGEPTPGQTSTTPGETPGTDAMYTDADMTTPAGEEDHPEEQEHEGDQPNEDAVHDFGNGHT